jgi:tetratricopeptide (TPR) repeat protein
MTKQSTRTRRKFASVADEIDYLYNKILTWYYEKGNLAKSRRYAARMKKLLPRDTSAPGSIFGEECWSLVCEIEGDRPAAIRHRENEIRLIRRLHTITTKDQWALVSQFYGYSDLSDRMDLLALSYDEIGQTDRAIRILRESKALCVRRRIPFDGEEILEELLSDTTRNGKRNGRLAAGTR